jgi:hypothetical protein
VSFDWKSSLAGMQVGWIWVKQGFAKNAPRRCARQIAVVFEPFRQLVCHLKASIQSQSVGRRIIRNV